VKSELLLMAMDAITQPKRGLLKMSTKRDDSRATA
jgi:hypothetical protein